MLRERVEREKVIGENIQSLEYHIIRLEQEAQRQQDTILLQLAFKTEHERLLYILKGSKAFQKSASNVRDYKQAWDRGAATFYRLIEGIAPSTLMEVLTAALVASSLASVLDSKNETFGMRDEVLADLDRWRIAILEPSEVALFDRISRLVWGRHLDTTDPRLNDKLCADIQSQRDAFYNRARELIQRCKRLKEGRFHTSTGTGGDDSSPSGLIRGDLGGGAKPPIITQPISQIPLEPARREEHSLSHESASEILVLDPNTSTEPETRAIIAVVLMAGSLFWAVFTFVNREPVSI